MLGGLELVTNSPRHPADDVLLQMFRVLAHNGTETFKDFVHLMGTNPERVNKLASEWSILFRFRGITDEVLLFSTNGRPDEVKLSTLKKKWSETVGKPQLNKTLKKKLRSVFKKQHSPSSF